MSKFEQGDKVLVNGSLVAEIDFYDKDLDVVRFVTRTAGGTPNVTTAPVSQTQIEWLATPAEAADEEPEVQPDIEEPVDPNAEPNAEVEA